MSIVLVSLFENPLRGSAVDFLGDVLSGRVPAAVPTSAFLGAYHIATRYLKCPRDLIAAEVKETLSLASPAFVEDLSIEAVKEAVDAAMAYNIESWDGYLVALARSLNSPVIYSLDRDFKKIPDLSLVVPFSEEEVEEYHGWIERLLKGN
ncbi:MAG: PIN domain-containing protein [Euryarchaeota archaeon]|nr:PIN domain-containing protein [Euryarchaeota archaeon]